MFKRDKSHYASILVIPVLALAIIALLYDGRNIRNEVKRQGVERQSLALRQSFLRKDQIVVLSRIAVRPERGPSGKLIDRWRRYDCILYPGDIVTLVPFEKEYSNLYYLESVADKDGGCAIGSSFRLGEDLTDFWKEIHARNGEL